MDEAVVSAAAHYIKEDLEAYNLGERWSEPQCYLSYV